MLLIELELTLKMEGIDPSMYSLNGGLPNEVYCLNKGKKYWEVYYSERGSKSGIKLFDNEKDACSFFYNLLKNYPK